MSRQFYLNACQRTIDKLDELSITIPESALDSYFDPNEPTQRNPVESTDFYRILLNHFDSPVYSWYQKLSSNQPDPDWHVIEIDPGTSPLQGDEWISVSTDKITAFGFLLDIMQRQRIVPTGLIDKDDKLVIMGETGALASIYKAPFEPTSEIDLKRSEAAIKGLSGFNQNSAFRAKLNRIEGLSQLNCHDRISDNKTCMHVSCNNVSLSMQSALESILGTPIKQSLAQEVVASYFGFNNWNTFKGREKKQLILKPPFICFNTYNDAYTVEGYYSGLPSALHHFGKTLLKQKNQVYEIRPYINFYAFSDERALIEMDVVDIENNYKYVAVSILESSHAEENLLEYFHTGEPNAAKIIKFNERIGIKKEDHLFLDDWVFWLDRNYGSYGLLMGNKLSNFGLKNCETVSSEKHKASIVYDKTESAFWLATDWDEKPIHLLDGINKNEIEKLKNKYNIQYDLSTTLLMSDKE
ncbi:MAG: hypothetical protein QM504_16950 [Pseudomonadota bacterium]